MNDTITAVPGIEAGHYTDLVNGTGCTVVLCRDGAAGGVDVRGGSPGTRETNLLEPARRVERVFAVVLSGGSAFGLDAASGVMACLEEQGIGFKTAGGVVVPIVSSAILYDLGVITSKVRPGPQEGRAACDAAGSSPLEEGTVGAGTGATVAKTGGTDRAVKGGIGSAALVLPSGHVVGATVAVNAIGGIWDYADGSVVAGPRRTGGGFDDPVEALFRSSAPAAPGEHENTSIGVVATDARLNREEANYLARVSHDGSGPDHPALPHDTRRRHYVRHGHGRQFGAGGHRGTGGGGCGGHGPRRPPRSPVGRRTGWISLCRRVDRRLTFP